LREMGFQVTFIPEDDLLYMREYTPALQRAGIEVLYLPYVRSIQEHLKEHGGRYDVVFLFRVGVATRNIGLIRDNCIKAKVIYHTSDLHYLRMQREAILRSDKEKKKAADKMKKREFDAMRASDISIVHSTAELEILSQELPSIRPHVFPLMLSVEKSVIPFSGRRDIMFVGGFRHAPNVDAVQFFVSEVMPGLRKRMPGIRFYVIGSKAPPEIQALACEDVVVMGFVDKLKPILDQTRISVAPLRYGSGIKGKIGTALAAGLPVIATSIAVEGMGLVQGENVLVADRADQFIEEIVKLYQSETLWNRLSENGLKFADHAWSGEAAWKVLSKILHDAGIEVARGNRAISLYRESLDSVMTGPDRAGLKGNTEIGYA
jgi:O-antigen biosynthesis protein